MKLLTLHDQLLDAIEAFKWNVEHPTWGHLWKPKSEQKKILNSLLETRVEDLDLASFRTLVGVPHFGIEPCSECGAQDVDLVIFNEEQRHGYDSLKICRHCVEQAGLKF